MLLIVGLAMLAFTGFNFKTEKKVLDLSPLAVNREESHHMGWPV